MVDPMPMVDPIPIVDPMPIQAPCSWWKGVMMQFLFNTKHLVTITYI